MTDYVTFTLGACHYATPVARVREVVRLVELTSLPGMAAPMRGVLDLRGQSLPVLDIRAEHSDRGDVLVVDVEGCVVGFVCDQVTAVLDSSTLVAESLTSVDGVEDGVGHLPDYVRQVLRGPSGAVFLVDLEAMAGADVSRGLAELVPAQT